MLTLFFHNQRERDTGGKDEGEQRGRRLEKEMGFVE